jgi:hypothetical protein
MWEEYSKEGSFTTDDSNIPYNSNVASDSAGSLFYLGLNYKL